MTPSLWSELSARKSEGEEREGAMMDREGRADGREMRRERDKCKDEERRPRNAGRDIRTCRASRVLGERREEKRSPGRNTVCGRHDSIALGS